MFVLGTTTRLMLIRYVNKRIAIIIERGFSLTTRFGLVVLWIKSLVIAIIIVARMLEKGMTRPRRMVIWRRGEKVGATKARRRKWVRGISRRKETSQTTCTCCCRCRTLWSYIFRLYWTRSSWRVFGVWFEKAGCSLGVPTLFVT